MNIKTIALTVGIAFVGSLVGVALAGYVAAKKQASAHAT